MAARLNGLLGLARSLELAGTLLSGLDTGQDLGEARLVAGEGGWERR